MGACLAGARRVVNPCEAGPPNQLGVGRPCTEVPECQGQPAWNCPFGMLAEEEREEVNLPRWCSFLCETDADCGERAFCWQRESVEGVLVGSCALRECIVQPVDAPGTSE